MIIAKIVGSNSHSDYVARVVDELDSETPPALCDHRLGEFVSIAVENQKAIGLIYDTKLINPDYANFGPRLSSPKMLVHFSPDFINEQGILLGILLLGCKKSDGTPEQIVPQVVIPASSDVYGMDAKAVEAFHKDSTGSLRLHYLPMLIAHVGTSALSLVDAIMHQLLPACAEPERKRLSVIRNSLKWQDTFNTIKF